MLIRIKAMIKHPMRRMFLKGIDILFKPSVKQRTFVRIANQGLAPYANQSKHCYIFSNPLGVTVLQLIKE